MSKLTTKLLRIDMSTTTDDARIEIKVGGVYLTSWQDHYDEEHHTIHEIGDKRYVETDWAMTVEAMVQNEGRRYLSRDEDKMLRWEATATSSGIGHQRTGMTMARALMLVEACKQAEKIQTALQGKRSALRYYVDSMEVRRMNIYMVVDSEDAALAAVKVFAENDAEGNSPYHQAQDAAWHLNGEEAYERKTVTLDANKVLGKSLAARVMTDDPAKAIES